MSIVPESPLTSKERFWEIQRKMDAVNLQGAWPNFPGQAQPQQGRVRAAALLYRRLVENEYSSRRKKPLRETALRMRQRLLEEVERRLIEQDEDDLVLFLAG